MPPFDGPARDVVGDAVAGEDADRAVVHRGRDRDLDRLLALAEDADEVVVDPEGVGDVPQLLLGDPKGFSSQACSSGFGGLLARLRPPTLSGSRPGPGSAGPPSIGQATSLSW